MATDNMKVKISDLATIITIVGILMYSLGWIYWNTYFNTLTIDTSFIDIPFDRIIVTTWWFLIFSVFSFNFLFQYIVDCSENKKQFDSLIIGIQIFTGIYISIILAFNLNVWWLLLGMFLSIPIYKILDHFRPKSKINATSFTLKSISFILIGLIYVCSLFFNYNKAVRDANSLVDKYVENIEITLKTDSTNISGRFIGLMKNKYFILVKKNNKSEILVINESDASQIKLKK